MHLRIKNKEELLNDWNETKQHYLDTETAIRVLHEINDNLVVEDSFTAKNGKHYENRRYPTPEEIREKINYKGLSEEFLFGFIDFEDSSRNYILDDPDICSYFRGESSTGLSTHLSETNPYQIHCTHHIAYGGPNIWLDFMIEVRYKMLIEKNKRNQTTKSCILTKTDLKKIEYSFNWWSPTLTIDITSDPIAQEIYENDFEYFIEIIIEDKIENEEIEGIGPPEATVSERSML